MNVWISIVNQLPWFFSTDSALLSDIARVIRADKSFTVYQYSQPNMSDFLKPLEVFAIITQKIRDYTNKALFPKKPKIGS